ncbi:zinc finger MYM-type protein 4-like isoform 2-T2 [Odontesthes bonariensis]|uniref:zinc finger MYM-type protein 4-like isoform X2 n=1 Tax=Odontesthes bonariensis TaxID=219752 RepID=UPI003F58982B
MSQLLSKFHDKPNKVEQDGALLHLMSVSEVKRQRQNDENRQKERNVTVKYSLLCDEHPNKVPVCKATFLSVLGISKDRASRVARYYAETAEARPERRGGARNIDGNGNRTQLIINHIKTFTCRASHYGRRGAPGRRSITRPQNIILAPVDDSGTKRELCSHACLSSVETKRKMAAAKLLHDVCKICAKPGLCIFKVIVDGEGHGLCSRACLSRYQEVRGFPSCDVCGTICPDNRLVVNVGDGSKTICGDKCLVQFKEKVEAHQLCPTCRTSHRMSDMAESRSIEGPLDFFCSHRCLTAHRAQAFAASEEKSRPSCEEDDFKDVKPLLPSLECIKIKEEPIDEEYAKCVPAAVPQQHPKDEPNVPKEDLKIDSVFSLMEDTKPTEPTFTQMDLPTSCSTCKEVLMDGKTVYQRKGHPDIFCSTSCLLKFYQMRSMKKTCHFCLQVMTQPQVVLQAPVDNEGTMEDFCSQTCLSSFNYKRNMSTKMPIDPVASHSQCSVCSRYCISKHEVILQGVVHKLCSDPCFHRFCKMNELSVCENCRSCCDGRLEIMMEGGNKTLCSEECLTQLKQNIQTLQPCTMCRTAKLMSEMVERKTSENVIELFCSNSCVMASKIQAISASGEPLNCDNCEKTTLPACHLAMADASLRNFCTLTCAMAFKETQKDSISATNPAGAHDQTQSDFHKPTEKLLCPQCQKTIKTAPKVIQNKEQFHFVCSLACSLEFRKVNNMMGTCEHCNNARIINEVKRINNKDCSFCSDGCKMLFYRELEKKSGERCHSCAFCLSVSNAVVKDEGAEEDFCSADCRSDFKMLVKHAAKCDACSHKGRLKQSLPLLGDVKHFCNLKCLLHFCSKKVQTFDSGSSSGCAGPLDSSPVIANVISLSKTLGGSASSAQLGTFTDIQTRVVGHASVQTVSQELKNKSVLCVPLVHNKGVSCAVRTVETGVQTGNLKEKGRHRVKLVPVPVPVYVPLPMNMYSQFTPCPVALPVPLPVPVFLPERPRSSEPGTKEETLPESKEKDDGNEREDGQKDGEETEERSPSLKAHVSSYSDDSATDHQPASNNQEDFISDISVGSFSRPQAHEIPPPDPALASDRLPDRPPPSPLPAQPMRRDPQKASSPVPRQTQDKGHNVNKLPKKAEEKTKPRKHHRLSSRRGVDAWREWIKWRKAQTSLGLVSSPAVQLKSDLLRCSSSALNDGLCLFINEVKQLHGEPHSPDSLFYLCLSIQQYLYENCRMENIFSDRIYHKFNVEFTKILKQSGPCLTASGYICSCVEEDFLWQCKQLGEYSPVTILNTLLFFCFKYFGLTTVDQHRQLSFARLRSCTKTNEDNTKTTVLRFYPPTSSDNKESDAEGVPAKKPKLDELGEDFLEMTGNAEYLLRCPVRLYEFYLSKCSESVRQSSDLFYLQLDHSCVPSSPVWFSPTPLDDVTMDAMIVRILTIRGLRVEDVGDV